MDTCDNCQNSFSEGKPKKLNFENKLRDTENSVLDAIQKVFKFASGQALVGVTLAGAETMNLCYPCQLLLRKSVVAFDSFVESTNSFCNSAGASSFIRKFELVPLQAICAPACQTVSIECQTSTCDPCSTECQTDPPTPVPAANISCVQSNSSQTSSTQTRKIVVKKTPIGRKMKASQKSPHKKSSFLSRIRIMINEEFNSLLDKVKFDTNPSKDEPIPPLSNLTTILQSSAPIFFEVLKGACIKKTRTKLSTILPEMLAVIGIFCFTRNQKHNRFQKSIGVTLWRARASEKTYDILNSFGVCTSYRTVLNLLDNLWQEYDIDLRNWQKETTNKLMTHSSAAEQAIVPSSVTAITLEIKETEPHPTAVIPMDFDTTENECLEVVRPRKGMKRPPSESPVRSRLRISKRSLALEFDAAAPSLFYGLNFTFDNLNRQQLRRSYSSTTKTETVNVVSVIAIMNRIPIEQNLAFKARENTQAKKIPLSAFLPGPADVESIREDHLQLIKQIIVDGLDTFYALKGKVLRHFQDKYSYISSQTSKTINLGILSEDESTTEGMINIMNYIQRYLAQTADGKRFKTTVWGDGLTADKLRSAQTVRLNSITEDGKLDSLVPGVSHWHKRVILLTDDVNILLKSNELTFGKGSLPHLRCMFGHSQVSTDLKKKFNPTSQFYRFCLHSYICALALQTMEADNVITEGLNDNDLMSSLNYVANAVLNFEWHDIGRALRQDRYCLCNSVYEETADLEWVGCDNRECTFHSWYHPTCILSHIAECQKTKIASEFKMPPNKNQKEWYCTTQCRVSAQDLIYRYTRSFMFSALTHECYRSAIRDNAGLKLINYSKLHLIQLWNKHHTNYFRICHRMLACQHGFEPEHVKHDLIWNSTVNIVGGPGKNLEIDLFNEFVNSYLKGMVEGHGGQSRQNMENRSRAFGIASHIRAELEKYLTEDNDFHTHSKNYEKWRSDIPKCIAILRGNNVFSRLGKRSHEGFENFEYNHVFVDNIVSYKQAISQQSGNLDIMRQCWTTSFSEK